MYATPILSVSLCICLLSCVEMTERIRLVFDIEATLGLLDIVL